MSAKTFRSPFDLSGKVALVTGARRGLGFAMCQGLAEAGATVWLSARNPVLAAEAAAKLAGLGVFVRSVGFDIDDPAATADALRAIVDRDGQLDIVINNAAARLRSKIEDTSREHFAAHLATNLTSQFSLARQAACLMMQRRYGRIIMISSISAVRGLPGNAAYIAGKGGLEALTRALACEYGSFGITCNAIAPGKFATEFNAEALNKSAAIADIKTRCPLNRFGEASEIAGPCIFLASSAASYVNGHVLTVDGGYTIKM